MTLYKFEVMLDDIFIRYVEVSANRIGEATKKAEAELVRLYPNTYQKLTTSLYKTNDPKVQAQTLNHERRTKKQLNTPAFEQV